MTTALVIIDVQNAIVADSTTPERQPLVDAALDALVVRLAAVEARARVVGWPVILVQHGAAPGGRLATGTPGWQIRAELGPVDGDIVVPKRACDSFFETELESVLRDRGVTHLVIGGCMTQFCVDTTVRRAVSLGFDVTLLADGHGTSDMGALGFEAIIAHHNLILNGFDAGAHCVRVRPAEAVPIS